MRPVAEPVRKRRRIETQRASDPERGNTALGGELVNEPFGDAEQSRDFSDPQSARPAVQELGKTRDRGNSWFETVHKAALLRANGLI